MDGVAMWPVRFPCPFWRGHFMALKKLAAIAALVAVATPSLAFDVKDTGPSTMFYISIPLDNAVARKDREWAYGLQLSGKRDYAAVNIDSKMLNFLPLGGLEAKWIIAGVVATGAAVAVGSKDKGTSSSLNAQQPAQAAAAQAAQNTCPPVTSCAKK
jgi:hypothetical protein